MTPPNKRRFLSIDIRSLDNQTKEEHLDFDPELLSTVDLEKFCKAIEGLRNMVFLELARRCGLNRRPVGFYIPPQVNKDKVKVVKFDVDKFNMAELSELESMI